MFPKGVLREYASPLSLVARFLDIFCVAFGGLLAFYFKFGPAELPTHYQTALLVGVLLTLIIFPVSGIYQSWRGISWLHQARIITVAWISVVVVMIILAFATKSTATYSRHWMTMWALFGWVSVLAYRMVLYQILRKMRSKGWNHRRILIIGAGLLGRGVVKNIRNSAWMGFDIVGFLDDKEELHGSSIDGIEVKGGINNLGEIANHEVIDEILITLPMQARDRVEEILHILRHHTITVRYVPDIFGLRLINHSVTEFAGLPALNLTESPMYGSNRVIKAIEDKILAFLILLTISPLLLLVAIGVKISSRGPIFFRQERVSWNGKPFTMYKFRTMPVDVEKQTGPVWANGSEKRATPFGSFLRKTSLDELPQFWNVLKGDMSIVGPRPERPYFVEKFKEEIPGYMKKHMVKAGITGWAQINGWRGDTDINKRIEFDLFYVENWSLWFDIKIIFLTLFRGFVHKHAY